MPVALRTPRLARCRCTRGLLGDRLLSSLRLGEFLKENCEEQIDDEEAPEHDDEQEVDEHEWLARSIEHRVHSGRPAIEGDRLEELYDRPSKIVKVGGTVVDVVLKVATRLPGRALDLGLEGIAEDSSVKAPLLLWADALLARARIRLVSLQQPTDGLQLALLLHRLPIVQPVHEPVLVGQRKHLAQLGVAKRLLKARPCAPVVQLALELLDAKYAADG